MFDETLVRIEPESEPVEHLPPPAPPEFCKIHEGAFHVSFGSGLEAFDGTKAAETVPPGIYDAEVISGVYSQTPVDPTECDPGRGEKYVITYRIMSGPHEGETLRRTRTFSVKSLPHTKADLAQYGLTTTQAILSPFPPQSKQIYCRLIVGQRDWQGQTYPDVKGVKDIRVVDSAFAEFDNPIEGGSE